MCRPNLSWRETVSHCRKRDLDFLHWSPRVPAILRFVGSKSNGAIDVRCAFPGTVCSQKLKILVRILDGAATRTAACGNRFVRRSRRAHQVLPADLKIGSVAHAIIEQLDSLVRFAFEGVVDVHASRFEAMRLLFDFGDCSYKHKLTLANGLTRRRERCATAR